MHASALHLLPRLGDSFAQCALKLGRPTTVTENGYGIIRRFLLNGDELAVCFDRDRAVAVYCPYDATGARPDLVASRAMSPGSPRLLIGDYGWIIATPDCPSAFVRALSRTTGTRM